MLKNLKLATVALALAGSALAVAPAQALPITNWNFTVDSGFSTFAPTGSGETGINPNSSPTAANGLPSLLYWGCNVQACSSWLDLGGTNGHFAGSLVTNAPPTNTVTIIDHNFVIQGPSITSASIRDVLTLTPTSPAGPLIPVPPLQFDITYNETSNNGLAANCTAPSGSFPCADILVLSTVSGAGAFLNTSDPANVFLSQLLTIGTDNYLINLFIDGLGALTPAECLSAGAPSGCIGLITQEQTDNNFQVRLQIIQQTPEPISVSLFGAGLLGAGALRLRRKAKKA